MVKSNANFEDQGDCIDYEESEVSSYLSDTGSDDNEMLPRRRKRAKRLSDYSKPNGMARHITRRRDLEGNNVRKIKEIYRNT